MTKFNVVDKNLQKWPFDLKIPIFDPPGEKGNDLGNSESVMFLHSLRLSFMQKIINFYYRTVFKILYNQVNLSGDLSPKSVILYIQTGVN